MATWTNSDGLFIKFGDAEKNKTFGGSYCTYGPQHITEMRIDLTDLTSSAAIYPVNTVGVELPSGAFIESVESYAEVLATSGGAATFDFGLIRLDRTTELDYNGLLAAVPLAQMNEAGEKNIFLGAGDTLPSGLTGQGALIGTALANAGILTANYNTAAFTAGKLIVRVYWYTPRAVTP